MNTKFYQVRGFYPTLLAAILVITIDVITQHFKTLFVGEGGHIKLLGGGIGIILAIGLFLKWKYARPILATLVAIGVVVVVFLLFTVSTEYLLAYAILLAAQILTSYLLIFSKDVKYYVEGK